MSINVQLRARHSSPSVSSDDSGSEMDYEAIRRCAHHARQHGKYPEGFQRALRPFSLAEYRAAVDRITGINETSERSRLQEATAAANEDCRRRFNSHAEGMERISKHDQLFSLLVERSQCGNSIHRAILPCWGNDFDEYQADLILSVCEDTPLASNWLQTKLTYER